MFTAANSQLDTVLYELMCTWAAGPVEKYVVQAQCAQVVGGTGVSLPTCAVVHMWIHIHNASGKEVHTVTSMKERKKERHNAEKKTSLRFLSLSVRLVLNSHSLLISCIVRINVTLLQTPKKGTAG
ncbi:hypothetical protein INR49_026967 [Caranx melampygus]|nr:hypothetical protein INR49_026967 [Caranx melampygus]